LKGPEGHSFVVRIWWEAGLSRLNGRPLWRGSARYAGSGQGVAFQSLDALLRFIQSKTGDLESASEDYGSIS
jgi:hypothetical protein